MHGAHTGALTPIARWVQMAALGAAICNAFNQVVGSIMSCRYPCPVGFDDHHQATGRGETVGTLKPSHSPPDTCTERPRWRLFLNNKDTIV